MKLKGGFSHLPIARLVLSFSAYFTGELCKFVRILHLLDRLGHS